MERQQRHAHAGHAGHARAAADALVRATLSLGDAALRARYVETIARGWSPAALAGALDALCERAEQAETEAREALVAVVDALNGEGMDAVVQSLRAQAAAGSLLALERLIRPPSRPTRSAPPAGDVLRTGADGSRPGGLSGSRDAPGAVHDPRDQTRTLTLGERKWLARRPDRDTIQRMLADPHPDVIRRCLSNSRVTEDDVLRLAAKRPGRSEVLVEVARSSWARRPRIRIALVLNPATPLEIAIRASGLLLRHELLLVARSPGVVPAVRALCLEHLERRPPSGPRAPGHGIH
jgi:hypothetical protein